MRRLEKGAEGTARFSWVDADPLRPFRPAQKKVLGGFGGSQPPFVEGKASGNH